MFCELFGVDAEKAAATATKKKASSAGTKKKKAQQPKPAAAEQKRTAAPFKSVREKSPEPAAVPDVLEYDTIVTEVDDWAEDEECRESEAGSGDDNYDVTSMTMSEPEPEGTFGSVDSSPGVFFERRVKDPKKRPAGIALAFDDDSWIQ